MNPQKVSTYQACSHCTAKWFRNQAETACPRCGAPTLTAVTLTKELRPEANPPSAQSNPLQTAAALLKRIPVAERSQFLLRALCGMPPFGSIEIRRLWQLLELSEQTETENSWSELVPLLLQPPIRRTTSVLIEQCIETPSVEALQCLIRHLKKRSGSRSLRVVGNVYRHVLKLLRHGLARHRIDVDPDGWVSVSELLAVINNDSLQLQLWRDWQLADLVKQECLHNRQRIQIDLDNNLVRALYGHSLPDLCTGLRQRPPAVLFHGTSHEQLSSILQHGLVPARRTLAHLTRDFDYAWSVAMKHPSPVMLMIDAQVAAGAGTTFWKCNCHVWQCSSVPAQFIHEFSGNGCE